jgi:hypothetical protein
VGDVEVGRWHVQTYCAILLVEWQDHAVDNLAKTSALVLCNVAILSGVDPLLCLADVIRSNLDQSAVAFDGAVAETRVTERRLLTGHDAAACSDPYMLGRAVVFDQSFNFRLADGGCRRRAEAPGTGSWCLTIVRDFSKDVWLGTCNHGRWRVLVGVDENGNVFIVQLVGREVHAVCVRAGTERACCERFGLTQDVNW